MDAWQSIETAPKDGTTVLAHFPQRIGYVGRQDVVPVLWSGWGGGTWQNATTGHNISAVPTHWMPVPDPPVHKQDDIECAVNEEREACARVCENACENAFGTISEEIYTRATATRLALAIRNRSRA